jgi:hypothetical protein
VLHWKSRALPALVIALAAAIASMAGCLEGLFTYFGIFW